jgi:hypothetical protein
MVGAKKNNALYQSVLERERNAERGFFFLTHLSGQREREKGNLVLRCFGLFAST